MRSRIASRLVMLTLIALVSMLVLPSGTFAAKPQTIPIDDTFVDEFLTQACGFEVIHTVTGTIRVSEDAQGLFLARYSLKHTLTGPGGSLTFPDVGIDKLLAVTDDGVTHVETVMATGVLGLRIVIPGQGVVAANTGREIRTFTFDAVTGELLSLDVAVDSGLDQPLDDAAVAAICDALAG